MKDILLEVVREAWAALGRNRTRSFLTMLGLVWGIVAVTLLIAGANIVIMRHPESVALTKDMIKELTA